MPKKRKKKKGKNKNKTQEKKHTGSRPFQDHTRPNYTSVNQSDLIHGLTLSPPAINRLVLLLQKIISASRSPFFHPHNYSGLILRRVGNPEHEIDHDSAQQDDSQEGGTKPVIEARLPAHSYRLGSPVVRYEGVDHGGHGDACEEEGRDEGGPVAKVQHADRERPEDDGEVEP